MTNPRFKYTPPSEGTIELDGITYSVVPTFGNFHGLRKQLGEKFDTFGTQLRLFTKAYLNSENQVAEEVIKIGRNGLYGVTSVHGFEDLVFAVDYPEIKDGRIKVYTKSELEEMIGSSTNKIGFVSLSKDGKVRACPREHVISGKYNPPQIAMSPLPVLFAGYEGASYDLARASEEIDKPVFLCATTNEFAGYEGASYDLARASEEIDKPVFLCVTTNEGIVIVPVLNEDDSSLYLGGNWNEFVDRRYSFGVLK